MSLDSQIRPAVISLGLFTLLLGGAYPLASTALVGALFPNQSAGSLIRHGDTVIGSRLIGQNFTQPQYLWGRLSATGPAPYNAGASSGSNLGVNNPALLDASKARLDALNVSGPVPVNLMTASGSGLDPHISPAAAAIQVPRIAAARNLPEDRIRAAIAASTEDRTFGILGEARVNVLEVNLRLDGKFK
ncbi:potassium-transporting ATPase subunit KdpC [Asticcacaulis sp. BYS171W]|uniref:Potassium-transporting ATPase KdpC subunit n=1 Tax=Asticcacaulis aquaticus TaxID=2984212 RepID=A0ABT5HVV8_9CAUL|nr:potassium-transporting ATPase subunit KdpC [Asticcacaulis aquaticus]MDC7684226.1 potassium-transporting ATPase subunit KdpC [Asticcacaulis aquaticus]